LGGGSTPGLSQTGPSSCGAGRSAERSAEESTSPDAGCTAAVESDEEKQQAGELPALRTAGLQAAHYLEQCAGELQLAQTVRREMSRNARRRAAAAAAAESAVPADAAQRLQGLFRSRAVAVAAAGNRFAALAADDDPPEAGLLALASERPATRVPRAAAVDGARDSWIQELLPTGLVGSFFRDKVVGKAGRYVRFVEAQAGARVRVEIGGGGNLLFYVVAPDLAKMVEAKRLLDDLLEHVLRAELEAAGEDGDLERPTLVLLLSIACCQLWRTRWGIRAPPQARCCCRHIASLDEAPFLA